MSKGSPKNKRSASAVSEKRGAQKGEFGYFRAEKRRRALRTAGLFVIPLTVFFAAWIHYKTRLTVWTVISAVGCIPACKFLVDLIMVLLRRSMDPELYKEIRSHAGSLTMCYEMYMTFYEKSAAIDSFAICGNEVVGYSSDPKIDTAFMAEEAQKIIRKNGYKVNVRILKELRPYLERLDGMNAHQESLRENIKFVPDERFLDLPREEIIRQVILAICL
ncbi:MAG: hypothetical protein IJW67_08700 [Blautia sp.]|nr:hypothetical protein [Blautia sp.]